MFKILRNDDVKKETGAIDEEDEISSGDEKINEQTQNPNNKKEEDSGSDSDPMEGQLSVKEQAALYSNIRGTID